MTGKLKLTDMSHGGRAFHGVDDMRAWCFERNRMARDAGWLHWLYVSTDKETGVSTIKTRTGSDALDVMKVIRGWYPDFTGWAGDRLESEFRILRHMARNGMTDEALTKVRFAK